MASAEAEGRTEKATPKRQGEARRKGQIARSSELSSIAGLVAGVVALVVAGPHMLTRLEAMVTRGLAQAGNPRLATAAGLGSLLSWAIGSFTAAVAPVVIAAAIAGLLANLAQVRLTFSFSVFKPTLSKINPGSGLRRLFGPSGLVEAGKATVKLAVVGGMAFLALWPHLPRFGTLIGIPPANLISQVGGEVISIVLRVGGVMLVLAVADYLWQRRKIDRSLRMTKEEVKQEARQTEGAPELRGAIKRKQFQLARRRMLAEVPTADVVVVNPTHYAAALRYDGSTPAPELVAKGVDHVAAAIRAVAEEHGVPIVANPPLARTLYRQVELGAEIPGELYAGVAEVLAYVYRIAGRRLHAARRRRRRAALAEA